MYEIKGVGKIVALFSVCIQIHKNPTLLKSWMHLSILSSKHMYNRQCRFSTFSQKLPYVFLGKPDYILCLGPILWKLLAKRIYKWKV